MDSGPVAALLAPGGAGAPAPPPNPWRVQYPLLAQVSARVQGGDRWRLGAHTLVCGDATRASDVALLMGGSARAEMLYTDPPYAVGYTGGRLRAKRFAPLLAGDTRGAETVYAAFLPLALRVLSGPAYCWFGGAAAAAGDLYAALAANRCDPHAVIVWEKTNATYAARTAHYKPRHELLLHFSRRGAPRRWCGATTEHTIWAYPRDTTGQRWHPTQKPQSVILRALANHTAQVVLDPFSGAGSTLMACEILGRAARTLEIEPAWCDATLWRWECATGQRPVLEYRETEGDGPR